MDYTDPGQTRFDAQPSSLYVAWWWGRDLIEESGWLTAYASTAVEIEFWSRTSGDWLSIMAGPGKQPCFRLPAAPSEVLVRQISSTSIAAAPQVVLEPARPFRLAKLMARKALARIAQGDFRRLLAGAVRLADRSAPAAFVNPRDNRPRGTVWDPAPSSDAYGLDPAIWPDVSIVIPTKDQPALLAGCLKGLRNDTDYPRLQLVLVDNGTTDPEALALLKAEEARSDVIVHRRPGPFNFSALCNAGVAASCGEIVVLLNNDVTPRSPDWLRVLVREAILPQVGVVGPLLLYPDDTVQCASVAIGLSGGAGHPWRGTARDAALAAWRTGSRRPVSALTGACLALRREVFDAVGGFDEVEFPVSLNDVDLCLRIGAQGLDVIYAPAAEVIHHESRSRRSDHHPAERGRRVREQAAFRARWREKVAQDPWYPPFLTRSDESGEVILRSGVG